MLSCNIRHRVLSPSEIESVSSLKNLGKDCYPLLRANYAWCHMLVEDLRPDFVEELHEGIIDHEGDGYI